MPALALLVLALALLVLGSTRRKRMTGWQRMFFKMKMSWSREVLHFRRTVAVRRGMVRAPEHLTKKRALPPSLDK